MAPVYHSVVDCYHAAVHQNPETDGLARELADLTGDSLTGAVTKAVQAQLAEIRRVRIPARVPDEIEHPRDQSGQDGQAT